MLVLSRKVGEKILIAGDIEVVVTAIKGARIRLAIQAPRETRVLRGELMGTPRSKGPAPRVPRDSAARSSN